MESGKKDDKKKMIQTTIHRAEDEALGKSQVTKVAWIALESLQYRENSDGQAKFYPEQHSVWYMCGGLSSW